MSSFLKKVVGVASLAAIGAGVYYAAKKWLDEQDDMLEDDCEDFDLDDTEDSREYVTLDIEDDEEDDEDVSEETAPESEEETPAQEPEASTEEPSAEADSDEE